MEERKSMGGALVDVFDAGLTLVKSEINAVARKAGEIAKAKGIGAVLLLASTGPLILGLIFIILAVFYGLMRLGLGAWAAALIIALLSFAVTGALIVLGIKKLGTEVQMNEPRFRRSETDTAPATSASSAQPFPATNAASHTTGTHGTTSQGTGTHSVAGSTGRDAYNPSGPRVEIGRDASTHAAGETRVTREGGGTATIRVEGGETTVPVYESKPSGEPVHYGSGLNKQIDGSAAGEGHHAATRGHQHDPNLQEPVVLKDAPGIPVSTAATFRDDMKKGGQS
ncbi:phage holin family protein [Deinococcus sp.]|uniref:phage holin family protein n=1 Tax=Deinococcus sp. TaxID=47478 RepID=UPI0025BDB1D5|nr:phage holin family protein [Deinococcus sp.]